MSNEEKVSLTISITKDYRDRLRTMAAEQNLQDPDLLTSASTIARQIICNIWTEPVKAKRALREEGNYNEKMDRQVFNNLDSARIS